MYRFINLILNSDRRMENKAKLLENLFKSNEKQKKFSWVIKILFNYILRIKENKKKQKNRTSFQS